MKSFIEICGIKSYAEARMALEAGATASARRIRDAVANPLYLAGGLNAGNVADSVCAMRPHGIGIGIGICGGVRANGGPDPLELRAFVEAAGA